MGAKRMVKLRSGSQASTIVPEQTVGLFCTVKGFPGCASGKELASAGAIRDVSSIPRSRRSPGEGPGNPLQYSCPENLHGQKPVGLQSIGLHRIGHD